MLHENSNRFTKGIFRIKLCLSECENRGRFWVFIQPKSNLFSFTTNNFKFRLKQPESFFLEVALRNGRQVKTEINPKYILEFNDWNEESEVKKINTDGRYYQIVMKDNTTKTIDIGYNFIEKNPIIKKNREN